MPNYCENDLRITSPRIAEIIEYVKSTDKRIFDFDKIIPYPKEYRDTDERAREYELKTGVIHKIADEDERLEKLLALKAEYGLKNDEYWLKDGYNSGGYDWCITNWGTKWNACDPISMESGENIAIYHFDTAWSSCEPIIDKLSEIFPEATFTLKYYECGMAFRGIYKVRNNKILLNKTYSYAGNRGG